MARSNNNRQRQAAQEAFNEQNRVDIGGIDYIDYKDVEMLKRFLNEQGKMLPRRVTGVSAQIQRQVTRGVKRARHLALLAFVADTVK